MYAKQANVCGSLYTQEINLEDWCWLNKWYSFSNTSGELLIMKEGTYMSFEWHYHNDVLMVFILNKVTLVSLAQCIYMIWWFV